MDNESELKKEDQMAVGAPTETAPSAENSSEDTTSVETTPIAPEIPPESRTNSSTLPTDPALATSPLPTNRMPTLPQLAIAVGALVLIFAFSYLPIDKSKPAESRETPAPAQEHAGEVVDARYFENVSITAEAAYVWDVKNQRALYNKNAGKHLPLASLAKLMTTILAYEHLDPEDKVVIPPQALLEEGDSGLASGEIFTMRELASLTLVASSNDGAYALAAATGAALALESSPNTFIDAMNAKAEEIGLLQSYFTNPTGLDVDGAVSGSYGSARDMAFLMEYLVSEHPEILEGTNEATSLISDEEGSHILATNTNDLVPRIPGLIGSKTGFTNLAGGNLVVAYDAGLNRPIVIAVLGSSREGRFSDVMTLIEKTTQAVTSEQP